MPQMAQMWEQSHFPQKGREQLLIVSNWLMYMPIFRGPRYIIVYDMQVMDAKSTLIAFLVKAGLHDRICMIVIAILTSAITVNMSN